MPSEIMSGSDTRRNRRIAVEFALVTAVLVGSYLWQRIVTEALSPLFDPSPTSGGLLLNGVVTGGLFVTGLVLLVGTYATFRDIEIGLTLPSRRALPTVGMAGVVPVLLVGLTKLVGTATDVPYNSLTMTSVGADAPVTLVLLIAGLGAFVTVPALVVVCQVLVQGSFRRVVGGDIAVVLTTVVAGFVMVNDTGGLATVPDQGKLVGAVLFTLALGFALYATERIDRRWVRSLAYFPVLLFAVLTVLSGVVEIESLAEGLFAVTQLAVFATAAYTYERTASLLAPALTYVSLLLSNRFVVFVFEAGMESW